jgi:hypothetical protein
LTPKNQLWALQEHNRKSQFGDLNAQIFAVDVNDGTVSHTTDYFGGSPTDGIYPLVYDDTVFFSRYCLEARDPESFELRWRSDDDC